MYETYIFDLYGTLIDIETDEEDPVVWERLALHYRYAGMKAEGQALNAAVLEASERQLAAGKARFECPEFVMEQSFGDAARQLGGQPTAAWLNETVRWLRTLSMRKLALYDGADELLESLRAAGKKLYLLSNGQRTFDSR
ncbi:HAD family hydrolase [Paenibacillus xanthanilyticus]|uniref:HAD family hydrolase n=1 Tax=Paenibacillus xanthanilyticus TaxID=1783531 RepID=A0ABV8K185_9BACL